MKLRLAQKTRYFPSTAVLKILLLIFSLSFLIKLGSSPLLEIDEAVYAEVAREAFTSGDYFSTYFNYETELSKPPFQYWLLQISYAIFGINEWAVRLPSFIMALGVLYLTYLFGKHFKSPSAGLWACLVLCANPGFYSMLRDTRMDITLTFFITLSIYGFYVYVYKKTEENLPRPIHWMGAPPSLQRRGMGWSDSFNGFFYIYVGMAAATLTKGPIGLLFPSLIILTFILLRRNWNLLRNLKPFYGLLLLILIITPWYIYMTQRYGFTFIEKNVIHENFKKFLVKGIYEPNTGGYFFLSHTFLWYFFPWWIFYFYQQYQWIRGWSKRSEREKDTIIFMLLWSYIPFIFFSLSQYSLPNYLSVITPAFSGIVGLFIDSSKDKTSITIENIFSIFSIPFLLLFLASAFFFFRDSLDIVTYLLVSAAIFYTILILISGTYRNFFITKIGMILLIMIIQITISLKFQPILDSYKPAKPISKNIMALSKDGIEVGFYKTRFFQSLVFYTGKKIKDIGSEDSLLQFINSPGNRFIITEEDGYKKLPENFKGKLEIIKRYPYFPVSRMTYRFLNPHTRGKVIKNIILIKKIPYNPFSNLP
ncbi:MAG: glycosyltransferase family 39 protein [Nitrospinota bacterium]